MKYRVLFFVLLFFSDVSGAESSSKPKVIWDISRIEDRDQCRIEFPDLIRFKGKWFCLFREGLIHGNDDSGRARIISSADGNNWKTTGLFEWEGGDVRDPRLSITAEGVLMINAAVYFITAGGGTLESDVEDTVKRQSTTWLSRDGENWSSAYACSTGINTWRWDATWHEGMGYSVAYHGRSRTGTLYRTRDGKTWRSLRADFFPEAGGSEAALAFPEPNQGVCLMRQYSSAGKVLEAKLGIGKGPSWQEWEWKSMQLDWADGRKAPRYPTTFAGPKLLVLKDGRLIATARNLGFWLVDPKTAKLTQFAQSIGNSYPGLVEHEGKLWVTSGTPKVDAIVFAALELPK